MEASGKGGREGYIIDAVLRACELLAAFQHEGEALRLKDLVARTGLNNTTVFRLLCTLEKGGLIKRAGKNLYRSGIKPVRRSRYKFGYASQGEDSTFAQEWSESIIQVAGDEGIEVVVYNNGFDPETTLRNVDMMIEEGVDLAIEHQFNEHIAPIIASRLLEARIPLIGMGTAHPGALYYGGNNYSAGLIGGRYLGRWARQQWRGKVDEVVLLELSMAGPLLHSRLKGVEAGVKEALPEPDSSRILYLKGSGQFGATLELMRKHLNHTRARRILVGAINDPCALGALRALEESGWSEDCAVMGQGGSIEGRAELRRPGTRLIGTVAFFPERYGEGIIRLALDVLQNKPTPPAVFVKHRLLTPANVDQFYPNDVLIQKATTENPLLPCASRVAAE